MLHNPFAELSALISPDAMQFYVVLMFVLVFAGTVLDILHKQSATYFFRNAKKAEANAKTPIDSATKKSLAIKTVTNEVLTSSEFHNQRRRISHLFTMYGFITFVLMTVILVFAYPTTADAPAIFTFLWHLGALSLCVGGYWFWFAIRVDVAAEGVKWYQFNGRGDLFILGLLFTATFGLLWSFTQQGGAAFSMWIFALFILSATVLFGSVYWSKFAHMFFKPAAAFQKKVAHADGSAENLPGEFDLTDPEVHAKFPDLPEYLGKNPPNMGLGIKREEPNHY
jgi:ABC-type multidrug transport system fused ATPase/permease subunit